MFSIPVDKYHITEVPCVDAMHDILEGVAKYDLGYIPHHYIITLKIFSLRTTESTCKRSSF